MGAKKKRKEKKGKMFFPSHCIFSFFNFVCFFFSFVAALKFTRVQTPIPHFPSNYYKLNKKCGVITKLAKIAWRSPLLQEWRR